MAVASCAGLFQGILMMVRSNIIIRGSIIIPRCAKHSEKLPTIADVPRLRLLCNDMQVAPRSPARMATQLHEKRSDANFCGIQ